MLLFLAFDLPADSLAIYHPDFPDPLARMSDDERRRTVF